MTNVKLKEALAAVGGDKVAAARILKEHAAGSFRDVYEEKGVDISDLDLSSISGGNGPADTCSSMACGVF